MAVKRVSNSFLAQGGNFLEHTAEEDLTYPVPYPKILSYNGSTLNIKSVSCWRTALGLGLGCSITRDSEI